jgi:hypothetical protein
VDLVSLVSNNDQRLDQNVLKNFLSQSNIMFGGRSKCIHTCSNKILEVASNMILFFHVVKMFIFDNRSTTTNTKSFPCLVEGIPDM